KIFKELNIDFDQPLSIGTLFRRVRIPLKNILQVLNEDLKKYEDCIENIEENLLYKPYKEREKEDARKLEEILSVPIPEDYSFEGIPGLRKEVQEKILKNRPKTLGELSKIPGVTPASILAIYVAFRKRN
ncbi:MAG: hypothetical protein WHV67_08470, partial [Thermoanaerobaculia bacterium]